MSAFATCVGLSLRHLGTRLNYDKALACCQRFFFLSTTVFKSRLDFLPEFADVRVYREHELDRIVSREARRRVPRWEPSPVGVETNASADLTSLDLSDGRRSYSMNRNTIENLQTV